jgi:hypothetical protein
VQSEIAARYQVPAALASANRKLRTRVTLWIASDGRVSRHTFQERSGVRAYDDAIEAVLRNRVLPRPPAVVVGELADGVDLEFVL